MRHQSERSGFFIAPSCPPPGPRSTISVARRAPTHSPFFGIATWQFGEHCSASVVFVAIPPKGVATSAAGVLLRAVVDATELHRTLLRSRYRRRRAFGHRFSSTRGAPPTGRTWFCAVDRREMEVDSCRPQIASSNPSRRHSAQPRITTAPLRHPRFALADHGRGASHPSSSAFKSDGALSDCPSVSWNPPAISQAMTCATALLPRPGGPTSSAWSKRRPSICAASSATSTWRTTCR